MRIGQEGTYRVDDPRKDAIPSRVRPKRKGSEEQTRQLCGLDLPLELTNIYESVITYY